jgi:hypothetical protein
LSLRLTEQSHSLSLCLRALNAKVHRIPHSGSIAHATWCRTPRGAWHAA